MECNPVLEIVPEAEEQDVKHVISIAPLEEDVKPLIAVIETVYEVTEEGFSDTDSDCTDTSPLFSVLKNHPDHPESFAGIAMPKNIVPRLSPERELETDAQENRTYTDKPQNALRGNSKSQNKGYNFSFASLPQVDRNLFGHHRGRPGRKSKYEILMNQLSSGTFRGNTYSDSPGLPVQQPVTTPSTVGTIQPIVIEPAYDSPYCREDQTASTPKETRSERTSVYELKTQMLRSKLIEDAEKFRKITSGKADTNQDSEQEKVDYGVKIENLQNKTIQDSQVFSEVMLGKRVKHKKSSSSTQRNNYAAKTQTLQSKLIEDSVTFQEITGENFTPLNVAGLEVASFGIPRLDVASLNLASVDATPEIKTNTKKYVKTEDAKYKDDQYLSSFIQSFQNNPRRYKVYPHARKYRKALQSPNNIKRRPGRPKRKTMKQIFNGETSSEDSETFDEMEADMAVNM